MIRRDLHLSGSEIGVLRALRSAIDLPLHFDYPLVSKALRGSVEVGRQFRVEYHLNEPLTVAQVYEYQVPMVAPAMHPSGQRYGCADIF